MRKSLISLFAAVAMLLPGLASADTILITGSNRGIGLGLAEAYTKAGWRVIATARSPERADELNALAAQYDNLTVDELDVTDDAEIAALAAKYDGTPIDVLLNNAGVLGDIDKQSADNVEIDEIKFIMDVNVYGPIKIARAFLPHVKASEQKKILTMTSGLGSMTLTQRIGRFYGYRMSKAAVNMFMRAMHADFKSEGVIVGLIAPGQVETELLFASGFRGPGSISVEESVAGLMQVVDDITLDNVGLPINYNGEPIPW